MKCHYSCKLCTGPNDNNCSHCYPDAQLHRNGHCHSKELIQELSSLERWYTIITVIFLCLCFLILVLVIYILLDKNPNLFCCLTASNRHTSSYDGLPLRKDHRLKSTIKLSTSLYRDDVSEDDLQVILQLFCITLSCCL